MTEYLTLMISAPLQGSDPKGPHLGAVGNHTWSEVLGIAGSALGHWGLGADSSWVPKGQPASSFQAHLTERQGKVCCIGNVHSQPAVTVLLRNSVLWHPGRLKHPGFPSQLQFKEAAWWNWEFASAAPKRAFVKGFLPPWLFFAGLSPFFHCCSTGCVLKSLDVLNWMGKMQNPGHEKLSKGEKIHSWTCWILW